MSSDVVIRAKELGKVYRLFDRPSDRLREALFPGSSRGHDFWALRGLDLEIRRGETVGVVGRNGSGKSTLLQLICGTTQPSAGELEVHGRVAALLELGAGFNPEFTGRENVQLSAAVLGLTEKQIAERLPAIEAFAEIGSFIDQPVRQYSSGMYARLAFSVCAHVDADILVIDEILSVGDAGFQQRCMRFLHAFRRRGTLLFVSHDEGAVLSLCDHALWLHEGQPWAAGASKDVCAHYRAMVSRGDDDATFTITPGAAPAAKPSVAASLKPFDFDLDASWERGGEPIIEGATLSHPDGRLADAVDGDGEVVLRVEACASRALEAPIVAFVLRNRLGQAILRDNSAGLPGVPAWVEPNRRFGVRFRFRLPHLTTGDYSVEIWLFEPSFKEPVDGLRDFMSVRVNSLPHFGGLANVALREQELTIGDGPAARNIIARPKDPAPSVEDPRWQGKNPIAVLPFNSCAPAHGHGGGKIEHAGLFRPDGSAADAIQGGEEIELRIRARAERTVAAPILGFILRNSLGQNVWGDNTFVASQDADRTAQAGETLMARFRFQMPYLPAGEYAFAPSIIDGTQSDHVHLHWMEEALILHVTDSPVSRSVVGVPMLEIRFDLAPAQASAA